MILRGGNLSIGRKILLSVGGRWKNVLRYCRMILKGESIISRRKTF